MISVAQSVMLYPSQHLSLEYEPDDFSDKSSRDGEEECSGSRCILLMDDDEEEVTGASPAVAVQHTASVPQEMTTQWPEAASDISGWTATSSSRLGSSLAAGAADKQSRRRRPRPWDEIPITDNNAMASSSTTATAFASSQGPFHSDLPPIASSSSAPTTLPKDNNKKLNSQPSGERTPLLKQHSSRESISSHSYSTQPVRNVSLPAYQSTSGRRADLPVMDTYTSKRLQDTQSPTAFSSIAPSTAPTVSTFASFFSKLNRRRKAHLQSPPTQFTWSGGFFSGGGGDRNPSPSTSLESFVEEEEEEDGHLWSRLLLPKINNDKSNHRQNPTTYHSNHAKNKGIHHATFRAATSNYFYQEDSYEDVEGPSSFIHTTFLAKKKKKRSEWFVHLLSLLMIIHFIIMMGYESLLWYISFRRGQTTTNNLDHPNSPMGSSNPPPPFWFSSAGRIYNPSIGPNPTTLTLFGIFNPALCLLKSQYWVSV